jgi:hypothetical protein
MSAGLAASTVTPGITAPDVSLTTPAMVALPEPCAHAADGANNKHDRATRRTIFWAFIPFSSSHKNTRVLFVSFDETSVQKKSISRTTRPERRQEELMRKSRVFNECF